MSLAPTPFSRLSKTRFTQGLQCAKQLWWRVHEPSAPELAVGPSLQAVFDRGHRVGEAARGRFPRGVLIEGEYWDVEGKVERTRRAMAEGATTIFEASFLVDGVFVAVDVLERRGNGWGIVEVKSTTDVKDEHIPDVAVQWHVVRGAGLEVKRAEVMHLNSECRFPDLTNLFTRADVTRAVEALLPGMAGEIGRLKAALAGALPDVGTGPHCSEPYECPFMARCWPVLPEHHVSTLYRIGKRADEFVAAGHETIHALPADVTLSGTAARQVRSVKEGRVVVEGGLAGSLASIEPPVAFLDFETVAPAIPAWNGCHPYEPVAVQMSCHVRDAGGGLAHHAFLAEGPGDPRPAIAEAIVAACRGAKTVVAYFASFEKQRLEHLAEHVPSKRRELLDVAARLVDLLPIVRDHVYHPDFAGSFSLKSVTPALVPELAYDDLEVAEGETASALLEGMLLRGDGIPAGARETLRRQLHDYCERDTLATVRVYERLVTLV